MFSKNSYKLFNRLTKKKVLHDINLTGLLQNSLFLWKEEGKLIHQCFRAGNKQTLFWVRAHKYFVQDQTKVGKEIIFQANVGGDKNAKYGLAIALLCKSNDEWIQLLLSILNQPDGKLLLQNYQQILQHTTSGTNTFRIPNNQACKKNGVGHWDHECPYPYGNEELHVTCKMCSIDLEIYKLANRVR